MTEIIIGIGGLILLVLTYFANAHREKKRNDNQEKTERINAVVNKYLELRQGSKTAGLDGLQKSGVATLQSDAEIRECINQIMSHGEKHPLHAGLDELNNIDLKIFFDYASNNGLNFLSTSFKDIINDSGA